MALLLAILAGLSPVRGGACDIYVLGALETRGEYFEIVGRYVEGDAAGSVRALLASPRDGALELAAEIDEVRRYVDAGNPLTKPPTDTCVHAAALLETETAAVLARSKRDEARARLDAAWELVSRIDDEARRTRAERDWLYFAALLFQSRMLSGADFAHDFQTADRYFVTALRHHPSDAEILTAHGTLLEWASSLPNADASLLSEAMSFYSRALETDNDHAEALVRYGLTLRRAGEVDEAEERLTHAVGLDEASEVNRWRAHMALGAIAEEAGELDDALRHFESAVELRPRWQRSRLAQAHALHEAGLHERARRTLSGALGDAAPDETGALEWGYILESSRRREPLLIRMRLEARQ